MRKEQLTHTLLLFMIAIGILGCIHLQPDTVRAQENDQTYPECWVQPNQDSLLFIQESTLPQHIPIELITQIDWLVNEVIGDGLIYRNATNYLVFVNSYDQFLRIDPNVSIFSLGMSGAAHLNPDNLCELIPSDRSTTNVGATVIFSYFQFLQIDGPVCSDDNVDRPFQCDWDETEKILQGFEQDILSLVHEIAHAHGGVHQFEGYNVDDSDNPLNTTFWNLVFMGAYRNQCSALTQDSYRRAMCEYVQDNILEIYGYTQEGMQEWLEDHQDQNN